jgi:Ca-activated chloride channel family protein
MTFLWPEFLWLLAGLPLLVALYVYLLRRRKKFAVRYSSLALLKTAMAGSTWRRHSAAGDRAPRARLADRRHGAPERGDDAAFAARDGDPRDGRLGQHARTDVEPNRLVAAQNAAKTFIGQQPDSVRIGIVAFAGTATVAQAPTRNKEDLYAGDRPLPAAARHRHRQRDHRLARHALSRWRLRRRQLLVREEEAAAASFKPVPPGSYGSAVIILLTDGQRTTGPDSVQAARLAADRGVRIFTVGVGTPEGKIVGFDGWSMHVRLDEDTLRAIADLTRGEYFYAGNAVDLKKIYQTMNTRLVMETKKTEISAFFAAARVRCSSARALSLSWFNRVV